MSPAGSPRLIAVGDNCLDVYIDKNTMAVGGNALNVAVQWHRAGRNARYFGAGDSFTARFIAAFCIDGHNPLDAMTAATRAAADTCQHKGGFPQDLRAAPDWIRAKYADTINAAKESF